VIASHRPTSSRFFFRNQLLGRSARRVRTSQTIAGPTLIPAVSQRHSPCPPANTPARFRTHPKPISTYPPSHFQSFTQSPIWPSRCHTNGNYLYIGSLLHPGCLPLGTANAVRYLPALAGHKEGIRGFFLTRPSSSWHSGRPILLKFRVATKGYISGVRFNVDGHIRKTAESFTGE
jgi:hypothetical protein